MSLDELTVQDLLEASPDGGVIRFAGGRAVIMDTDALGLLRGELVELFGQTAARGALTRFGFAHGERTAETVRQTLPWRDEGQWRRAGGRLHLLRGLVTFEPVTRRSDAVVEAIWRDSYEAEQHLMHFGRSKEPVCWSLCGFASGYLSYAFGKKIYCLEERCIGRGDPVCHMVGRPAEEWGPKHDNALRYFDMHCLDDALKAVRQQVRQAESRLAKRNTLEKNADTIDGLVAKSQKMRDVIELSKRVAPVDSTVLITGQSGTGKERIARLIHANSSRATGNFVAINCASLPETMLDSELFGHKKGAFTGASSDRPGLFEAAHKGTLFLGEIGEISPKTQTKLLRTLQEGEVTRLGENKSRKIDVRLLAATHRNLQAEIQTGSFRQDLYYRLGVVEINIAPLVERPEDILPLATTLLSEIGRRLERPMKGFSADACRALQAYPYPGNVRELGNAIEHAVALSNEQEISLADLPPGIKHRGSSTESANEDATLMSLDDVERAHILRALAYVDGNRKKAAQLLGIGQATLYRKLKLYS